MATATLRLSTPLAPEQAAPKRRSVFLRFYKALQAARLRAAMRELQTHRHLIEQDEVRRAGYKATLADAGLLPFVR